MQTAVSIRVIHQCRTKQNTHYQEKINRHIYTHAHISMSTHPCGGANDATPAVVGLFACVSGSPLSPLFVSDLSLDLSFLSDLGIMGAGTGCGDMHDIDKEGRKALLVSALW